MITHRELRNDSGEIMRALEAGEEFVVTRNGIPVGVLRPVRRPFVRCEVLLNAMRSAPAIDPDRLHSDLDAVVDQSIEPRA